jgi:predicted metalloprotease with PDZ domain
MQTKQRILTIIIITIAAAMWAGGQTSGATYSVNLVLSGTPRATVKADLQIVDGRLYMIGGAVNHLPRGWATFIQNIRVSDMNGKALQIEEFGDDKYKAQWRVERNFNGQARLTYDVDLSFSQTKWEAGNEQAAFFDGKALFAASRVLFIVSDGRPDAVVNFAVPDRARVATPWPKLPAPNSFSTSRENLLNNTLVVGDFSGKKMRFGNFEFEIALLGEVKKHDRLISTTLEKFAGMFSRIFPETPPSIYLITLFYASAEDGEAYEQSAAFTTRAPLGTENMIIWGGTLGHELFHFWCGQQIEGENYEESQWFQEGFTEYYANLALIREGILPERFFIWKAENILGKYLYFRNAPQFAKISVRDAGQRKTTYRFGVYDGGWAVAFALDLTIREKTAGKKSLDDFMRLMFRRFGLTKTKFKYVDLIAAASEIAGTDMSEFFTKYVAGFEVLPIAELLKKVGYEASGEDYASELYIYPLNPTSLKKQWLGIGEAKRAN